MSLVCVALVGTCQAEVSVDGSLGSAKGMLTKAGNEYTITENLGYLKSSNLFHSFGVFNLAGGEVANFIGDSTVTNILARVTGGDASNINGTLKSSYAGANLYFMNSHGIHFGPKAKLDVSGSFHATTADFVRLGTDGIFYADSSTGSTLTTAEPSAFGFLRDNPAPIVINQSELKVSEGETLSLIGGDVEVFGVSDGEAQYNPLVAGGHINITSTASPGEVIYSSSDDASGLVTTSQHGGGITVSSGAVINASGSNGGEIIIRGGRLQIEQSVVEASGESGGIVSIDAQEVVLDKSYIKANTLGPGTPGALSIKAEVLEAESSLLLAETLASGPGGNISIDVHDMKLTNGGFVSASAFGEGDAGNLKVVASGELQFSGQGDRIVIIGDGYVVDNLVSGVFNDTFSAANAGDIHVSAPVIRLNGGMIGADSFGLGRAGRINVETGSLEMTEGGLISTTAVGAGRAGYVNVDASESISINGRREGSIPAGPGLVITNNQSAIASITLGPADAGQVSVSTPILYIRDEGTISAASGGNGNGGGVSVDVGRLEITGGAQISSSSGIPVGGQFFLGDGTAGSVQITADKSVLVSGHDKIGRDSLISTNTFGSGKAGDIILNAPVLEIDRASIGANTFAQGTGGNLRISVKELRVTDGAVISATTFGSGGAGDIFVSADSSILMSGQRNGPLYTGPVVIENSVSGIFNDTFSFGSAGNIVVSAPVVVLDGGMIGADSFGTGPSGDIRLKTGVLKIQEGGLISTTAVGAGRAGYVNVDASESISINGRREGSIPAGPGLVITNNQSAIASITLGPADAGQVSVSTPSLFIRDEGMISAASGGNGNGGDISVDVDQLEVTGGAQISSSSGIPIGGQFFVGDGSGGSVYVNTDETAVLSGQSENGIASTISSSTFGSGEGGNITIKATSLTVQDKATVSASSFGLGNAGDIAISNSDVFKVTNSGSIETLAQISDGGDIKLNVGNLVYLHNSQISASVGGGLGGGGNVGIDPVFVVLDNSTITANAVMGDGGNIHIVTQYFIASPDSRLSASSELGIDGTVDIDGLENDVNSSIVVLPSGFLDASSLLRERCGIVRAAEQVSSLTIGGKGGLSVMPDDYLPSFSLDEIVGSRAIDAVYSLYLGKLLAGGVARQALNIPDWPTISCSKSGYNSGR